MVDQDNVSSEESEAEDDANTDRYDKNSYIMYLKKKGGGYVGFPPRSVVSFRSGEKESKGTVVSLSNGESYTVNIRPRVFAVKLGARFGK
jgi:hypothetical protein